MGTKKIRTFWTLTCLAAICLQCELISAEAPVTNYMSSYYDDAYHNEKSKSPGSPAQNPSNTYYPRHEADTEEEDDDEHQSRPHSHKPHPHRGHDPKHTHDEEYGNHENNNYRHGPPPSKSGPYKPSNFYGPYSKPQPSSKPYGKPYGPKSSYSPPTTGLPKYSITTSGPSYSGGSGNGRSQAPPKYTVGSSFSSSTGPGYSYSYGTKVTDEGKEETDKEHLEHSGPYVKYEESNAPKDSYNMNHMNTYKGADEESYKGGYTAGYPPISPYNTVKGNYDDYGHNDLSPKSPYKPSNKPITFSYSAPTNSEYGAPVDTPAGGNSYDPDDHSYTTSGYDKLKKGNKPFNTKSPTYFPFKSTPKVSFSSPAPKFEGPPAKYNGPPPKHFDGSKVPPSSTYATISNKSFAKSPSYSYGTQPPAPKGYYPQGPSNNYGSYYTNKDYEYSRSPSTSSVAKEQSPSRVNSGGYSRGGGSGGGAQRLTVTAGPPSFNRGPASFRGKGVPKNAYGYSYTAFSIFNKKGRGRGHSGGNKGRHSHAHGLAQENKQDYDYEGMESDEAEKREREALKNKRLFGSVGYSLGGARTFVKTPEKSSNPNSNGFSNAPAYGGGYDQGASYYL